MILGDLHSTSSASNQEESQSTDKGRLATPLVVALSPGRLPVHVTIDGHDQGGVAGIPPGANDSTTAVAPLVICDRSEQVALVGEDMVAVGDMHGEQSEQRAMEHNETALSLDRDAPSAGGGHFLVHQDVRLGRLDAAVEVRGLHAEVGGLPFTSVAKVPQHWHLRVSRGFEIDSDDEVDMEGDPSISVDEEEDKVGHSFGVLSNTTFDPRHGFQPPPYFQNVEHGDILIDNGPILVEDSAMEDMGTDHQEVAMTVTPIQPVQPLSWSPLVISNIDYRSHANYHPAASAQTANFVNSSAHRFQPTMLNDLCTLDDTARGYASFSQVVPPQEIAPLLVSDGVQPSTSAALEVEQLPRCGLTDSGVSPPPGSILVASHAALHSSLSPLSPAPPRSSSAPAPPPTHCTLGMHQRAVEDLARVVDPQSAVTSSQHEVSPLRYVIITYVRYD